MSKRFYNSWEPTPAYRVALPALVWLAAVIGLIAIIPH